MGFVLKRFSGMMLRGGISSSLALLASVMILMAQISINVAFAEVISEGALAKVNEAIREWHENGIRLVMAKNGSSIIIVNDCGRAVSISGLRLYYVNGRVLSFNVNWTIPACSVKCYDLGVNLRSCIAVSVRVEGYGRALYALNEV